MTFGSLFAGIGGIDKGLEDAGMTCAWQVEINDYCSRVLAAHWPGVLRLRDIHDAGSHNLPRVNLICVGLPCQDVSQAGKRAGIGGTRSGLWRQAVRVVRELCPRYVLVENVPGLLARGMGDVLGDLASLGYDAEWSVLSACAMGAPHTRERVFIVAYPNGELGQAGLGAFADRAAAHQSVGDRTVPGQWVEPFSGFCGMADGVPRNVDALTALGNAAVPAVVEAIGRMILEVEVT